MSTLANPDEAEDQQGPWSFAHYFNGVKLLCGIVPAPWRTGDAKRVKGWATDELVHCPECEEVLADFGGGL